LRVLTISVSCWLLFLPAAQMLALGTGKPLREYGQQAWQSDSGLPQNTVRAILQTRDGYLWIGTEAGLVRFDGVDFDVFDVENTPALHSDVISSLSECADGSLWIGTSGGLVRERAGVFRAYGREQGLPSTTVLALYRTRPGRLLALTTAGAAALDSDRFVLIAGTERLGLSEAASLVAEDAQGLVWIAGLDGTASVVRGDTKASLPVITAEVGEPQALAITASGELWVGGANGLAFVSAGQAARRLRNLSSTDVTSLLPAAGDGMWVGTSKGLVLVVRDVIRPVPEFAGMRVQALHLDRAGTVWVATSEGVARITHGSVDHTERKIGGVLAILEDREGSMWFGTETAGLHVLRDQAFSTITTDDGLSASLVRDVFQDRSGTMWMGTSGGGLDRLTAGRVSHFTGGLPSNVVLALAETEHDLWVGTPEGLASVRDGETRVFTTADGLADDFVRSLYADRDGSLWIGTRNGLSHYKDGGFRSYSKLDGLPSDLVGTILRDRAGTLWIGTLGGLSRMSGENFSDAPPQLQGAITALLEDGEGSLWAGINGRGLSRLRGSAVTSLTATNLPTTIYGMLEDPNGDLWLSSRTGVDRVSIHALDAYKANSSLAVTHYGSADGMRISEASGGGHPAAWRASDGGLWFATLNGAAVVYPHTGPRNPVPPLCAIEQVLIDDQIVARTGGAAAIRVAPGHGRVSIKYAGLSFVAPQRVRYRYMLEGFDKRWVEAGSRRTAFYTNVPPGSYRFLVRCVNSDGVWSVAPAEQRFLVEPFFYQTGWFYAAVALALAGVGYLIYKWRVLTVEAQYRAVIEERSRIAREIHDTLAQGYVAISVQLELAERLIASSTAAAVEQLKQTRELVREGLAEARSSIWNLRSQADAEALPSLLAAHVAAAASPQHADAAILKFSVHGAYRPLARSVEKEVMRVAQQAVANAQAHARAHTITVTLNYDTQWLALRVIDDGIGMGADETGHALRGHFGLQGMRERAARIGALLEIETAPGAGVTIALRVDLQRALAKDVI
jgi:ligand-binding sensor domain-containing protein/signal transduction histidine kinase